MADDRISERIDSLSQEVLWLSRNTLTVQLRFMDMALGRFRLLPRASLQSPLATDGQRIFYSPLKVLRTYKEEKEALLCDYLHLVLHCVLGHLFYQKPVRRLCWDTACDILVEHIIQELRLGSVTCSRTIRQRRTLDKLKNDLRYLTAESIYHYYQNQRLSDEALLSLREPFLGDSHELWYQATRQGGKAPQPAAERLDNPPPSSEAEGNSSSLNPGAQEALSAASDEELKAFWKQAARRMRTDMSLFSRRRGEEAGSLTQGLDAVTRERYDYREFLRQFCIVGEAMKVDEDEFDYIFYTYGMKLYGRMPLIEPLEYKDTKRIREFVIAIDTSASVSQRLVRQFMQKTYNILLQQENFFTKINLHILQCDAEIQEDTKITSRDEFDFYLRHIALHGFGGTDFRPVFDYVDILLKKREFTNLKGLIYFTDGKGIYPEHMPSYRTAFVFLEDGKEAPKVPVWAIRLLLEPEELLEEERKEDR